MIHPAALAAASAALVVAVWLILRRRPWRGARPRFPIVLVHGVFGFDAIGKGMLKRDYFRGIVDRLRDLGVEVHTPRVPPVGSVEERAKALTAAIDQLQVPRVNIIAHSMGGLDARYAIAHLGLSARVSALITIGTPHRGTPVANVTGLLGSLVGLKGLTELSTGACETFNQRVKDVRGVRYGCVLARVDEAKVHPLLRPTHARLGPSDGLVPLDSQRWGRVVAKVKADHWAQIGWSGGIDAPALYQRVARRLRAWGC